MKKKSKKSRLAYLRGNHAIRLQLEKEKKFEEKFGNIKEEEAKLEGEEMKYLEEQLLIREPTSYSEFR